MSHALAQPVAYAHCVRACGVPGFQDRTLKRSTLGVGVSQGVSISWSVMLAGPQQHDRVNVALAAVTCGRLSRAQSVRAIRGRCCARADQYGVKVTEPRPRPAARRGAGEDGSVETVLEHWGGDAEMLVWRSALTGAAQRSAPLQRARVAARTVRDHDLDSLHVVYPDGAELSANRAEVVLHGPRQGLLRRRHQLVSAPLSELL